MMAAVAPVPKRIEDNGQEVGGDRLSLVVHLDDDRPRGGPVDVNLDRFRWISVLDRVAEQIGQNLGEACSIPKAGRRALEVGEKLRLRRIEFLDRASLDVGQSDLTARS